jgi:hypothetical protein
MVHSTFITSISKYIKPEIFQYIHTHNDDLLISVTEFIDIIHLSVNKWYMIPHLQLPFLKLSISKMSIPELIHLFKILCKIGESTKIWYMIDTYNSILDMESMASVYMEYYIQHRDTSLIDYFFSYMNLNQDRIHNSDTLVRKSILYENMDSMTHIHSVYHVGKGVFKTKKRSITITLEFVYYSIRVRKQSMFKYLICNNTYYDSDLYSIGSFCVLHDLSEYILILQSIHPLYRYYTGVNDISNISVVMYHVLAEIVKKPEWFHHAYLMYAIQINDESRINDCIETYPYSICMNHHSSIHKSISKPWLTILKDKHPCGNKRTRKAYDHNP